jgi:hypothetical protein
MLAGKHAPAARSFEARIADDRVKVVSEACISYDEASQSKYTNSNTRSFGCGTEGVGKIWYKHFWREELKVWKLTLDVGFGKEKSESLSG